MRVLREKKKLLGEDHPNALLIMNNLASMYEEQGKLKEAEELEVQVIEGSEKALGREHPFTLTSIANLATIYSNQGRWKEVVELQVRVVEGRKKLLGEEHPETLMSMLRRVMARLQPDISCVGTPAFASPVQYY